MKTIIDYICIAILAIVCVYIVLAPWLSIMDISKSIDRLTDCLDKLISEVRDIDREIHLINERKKKNDQTGSGREIL